MACGCLASFALALFGALLGLFFAALGDFADQKLVFDAEELGAFFDVDVAHDGLRDDGDALHDAAYQFGAADGVFAGVFEQQVGLEADEVCLMFLNELAELCSVVLAGERVGVVAIGEEADFDVHALFEQHVDASQRCLDACHVAVVEDGDVGGEAVYHPYLRGGEGGA